MNLFKIASLSLLLLFLITGIVHADALDSVTAEIGVSTDSVNFGEVVVGDSLLKSIVLFNIGDTSLSLDSLLNMLPSFSAYYEGGSTVGGFDLSPDDSINIFILFKPAVSGEIVDTVFLKNSLGTIAISVSGTSIEQTKIEVAPEYFETTIIAGDSEQNFFSIENIGGADLIYDISISKGDGVLFSAIKEDLSEPLSHIVQYSPDTYEPVDTVFTSIFNEFRIVSLAYNSGYLYFQNFYDRSDIYVLDIETEEIVKNFKIQTENEILFSSLSHSGKNLYAAVNDYILEIDQSNGAILDTLIFEPVSGLVFTSVNESANIVYKNSGDGLINSYDLLTGELKGNLIDDDRYKFTDFSYSSDTGVVTTLGRNLSTNDYYFYFIDAEDGIIRDSTDVTNGSFIYALATVEANLSFLEILSEAKDTLTTGQSNQVNFEINTSDLVAGEYSSKIIIASNDTTNPNIEIPVTLTVEGGPEISVYPQSLDVTLGEGESEMNSFEITNIGNNNLNYRISSLLRVSDDDTITFFANEVQDIDSYILEYSLVDGNVVPVDTLLNTSFGAFGIRGMSIYKNELFFIEDKDELIISVLDIESKTKVREINFEDFFDLNSLAHYQENLLGVLGDFGASNNQYIVKVDKESRAFSDTLLSNTEFESYIQSISVNTQKDELFVLFNSSIEAVNLITGERREVLAKNEDYTFHHFSYSPTREQLYVSGYDFTKPESGNLGIFIVDVANNEVIDFIGFQKEFGQMTFDETGEPSYIEFISSTSSSIETGKSNLFNFKIDAKILTKGKYLSEFIISSNDRNTPELRVPLTLNILGGSEVSISVDSLEFEIMEGDSINASFEISNIGESDLVFDIRSMLIKPYESIFKDPIFYISTSHVEEGTGEEFSVILEYSFASNVVLDTVLTLPYGIDYINSLATDGQRLFLQDSNSSQKILVYDIETGKLVNELLLPVIGETHVYSLSYTKGMLLGVVQDTGNEDPNEINLVHIDSFDGTFVDTLASYSSLSEIGFISVSANPYKEELYIGNNSGEIQVIDTKTGETLPSIISSENYSFFNLSYSASLNSIITYGRNNDGTDNRLFQINVENGTVIKSASIVENFILSIATNESGFTDYIDFLSANIDTAGSFDSKKIDFKINTKDIYIGEYVSEFIIHSNDLDNPEVKIPFKLTVAQATSDEIEKDIPTELELSQNYPNPFNPTTNIAYGLPGAGNVQIKIYNVLGQEVMTLVDDFKQAGRYIAVFDARKLSSGMYFYRMMVDGKELEIKKMLLLK